MKTEKGTNAQDILLSLKGKNLLVSRADNGKIIVIYENSATKAGISVLEGTFGCGDTFLEACEDYLKQIRGKTLVFNGWTDHREEIKVLG